MILENLPKHHKDKENLDKALEEIKKMAKYIDEKKGEAMSKVKVGEIQSSMTNNCPVRSKIYILHFKFFLIYFKLQIYD